MPSIDWSLAGCANSRLFKVLKDFEGRRYVDYDLYDEQGGTPSSTFFTWTKQHIEPLCDKMWEISEAVQQPPMLHYRNSSTLARVVAYVSSDDDRVEYWTPAAPPFPMNGNGDGDDNEEEKEWCPFDMEFDHLSLVETADGHILIVGNGGCHPMVCCDLFSVHNSDGSTSTRLPKEAVSEAPKLIQEIIKFAGVYAYRQVH